MEGGGAESKPQARKRPVNCSDRRREDHVQRDSRLRDVVALWSRHAAVATPQGRGTSAEADYAGGAAASSRADEIPSHSRGLHWVTSQLNTQGLVKYQLVSIDEYIQGSLQ